MYNVDVWRAAHKIIEMYDLDACWNAGLRADHLLEQGDIHGFHVWVRIVNAIKELQNISQDNKDMRH